VLRYKPRRYYVEQTFFIYYLLFHFVHRIFLSSLGFRQNLSTGECQARSHCRDRVPKHGATILITAALSEHSLQHVPIGTPQPGFLVREKRVAKPARRNQECSNPTGQCRKKEWDNLWEWSGLPSHRQMEIRKFIVLAGLEVAADANVAVHRENKQRSVTVVEGHPVPAWRLLPVHLNVALLLAILARDVGAEGREASTVQAMVAHGTGSAGRGGRPNGKFLPHGVHGHRRRVEC
jgi:hypothetical protein